MSEAPDLTDDEALAAEYALGVLGPRERLAAEQRCAADPRFAELVEQWRERLQPLLDSVDPAPPPAELWARIERRLPANDNRLGRKVAFWRSTAIGALGLSAASLVAAVVVANQPPLRPPAAPAVSPAPLLNASLVTPKGLQPLFVAAYDPERKTLIITSLVPPGADPQHVHQLWLVEPQGRTRSLGFVEPGKSKAMAMPPELAGGLAEGASLAVSVEGPGGSKSAVAPTGPIAAAGALSRL